MTIKIKEYPTAKEIAGWLRYEANSGKFYWIKTNSNRVHIGSEAGSIAGSGHRQIKINRKVYLAHRLAWIVCYGPIPYGMLIDHINGVRDDNRISNLRLATLSNNQHNQRIRNDNTSGFKGVSRETRSRKWRVQVKTNGLNKHLGYFNCPTAAMFAVEKAAQELHGEFARAV